jgi:hypothetical protein
MMTTVTAALQQSLPLAQHNTPKHGTSFNSITSLLLVWLAAASGEATVTMSRKTPVRKSQ